MSGDVKQTEKQEMCEIKPLLQIHDHINSFRDPVLTKGMA